MKIGIVSDLHGKLPGAAVEALQGVDRIICAGDVEHHFCGSCRRLPQSSV